MWMKIKNKEQWAGDTNMSWKHLITYFRQQLVIHISTFLMVTLAVLTTRHLSFAAPALLVGAATFTCALKKREVASWVTHLSWSDPARYHETLLKQPVHFRPVAPLNWGFKAVASELAVVATALNPHVWLNKASEAELHDWCFLWCSVCDLQPGDFRAGRSS